MEPTPLKSSALAALSTKVNRSVVAVGISPNKRWVVAGQLQTNRPTATLTLFDLERPDKRKVLLKTADYNHAVFDVLFLADETLLYLEEPQTGQLAYQLYDVPAQRVTTLLVFPGMAGPRPRLPTAGSLLLAPSTARPTRYDFVARATRGDIALPPTLPDAADAVLGLDDEQHVLAAAKDGNSVYRVHLPTQQVVQQYELQGVPPQVLFAGKRYCGAIGQNGRGAHLWDKASGAPVGEHFLNNARLPVFSFCLSHDETKVAVGNMGFVNVIDIKSDQSVFFERVHGHDRVWALAFSADDTLLVSGGSRGDVIVTQLPQ